LRVSEDRTSDPKGPVSTGPFVIQEPATGAMLLRVRVLDFALADFLEGHRQVVLRARLHERGQELVERALAELVVVVVDLPGTLRRDDHQRIAGIDVLEQFVNAGMDHGREWYLRSATPGERSPPARPAPV